MVRRWIVGAVWIVVGCGPVVSSEGDGTSGEDTSGGSTSTVGSATTSSGSQPDPSASQGTDPTSATTLSTSGDPTSPDPTVDPDSSESGQPCQFIGCIDGGSGDGGDCDLWTQNCARGEKCMPWANDGGIHWNTVRCSPDESRAQPGDPCVVEGSYVSGIDNCALGSMCLFVDPMTNEGVCVANCIGSRAAPACAEPGAVCSIEFEGTMINCLAPCNPLLQDCIDGGCYPSDAAFVCGPTIGIGVAAQGGCAHDWDCVPGTVCLDASLVPMCEDEACCAPLCDLTMPEQCESLACVAWFEEGQAPPGLEQVGVCVSA